MPWTLLLLDVCKASTIDDSGETCPLYVISNFSMVQRSTLGNVRGGSPAELCFEACIMDPL